MNFSNDESLILTLEHIESFHEFPQNISRNIKLQLIAEKMVSVYEDIVIITQKGIDFLNEKDFSEEIRFEDDSDYRALYMEDL